MRPKRYSECSYLQDYGDCEYPENTKNFKGIMLIRINDKEKISPNCPIKSQGEK